MGVVAYFLLLFATFSLVSSDCSGIVESMNALFSSDTDESLNSFWTSFGPTCTEADKQAVEARVEKCNTPEGTAKACDWIYNKAMTDCAVFKVKDVNIDCDLILYVILAGTAKDGAKFSKLMEQIAMQVCIGPNRTICDEAELLCVKWPENSKSCDSVDKASRFWRLVKSNQRNIKDIRLLVNGKFSKFAKSFLENAWVPDDSIKWKSTECETLKNDLICKVINEKCKAKDGNFQKICESKEQKPKPRAEVSEYVAEFGATGSPKIFSFNSFNSNSFNFNSYFVSAACSVNSEVGRLRYLFQSRKPITVFIENNCMVADCPLCFLLRKPWQLLSTALYDNTQKRWMKINNCPIS